MNPAATVIAFDNVSKRYGGAAPVLDRVSLSVREREFLAIVGPSGSGKTTLLRLVNRLIDPSTGTVQVEGQDVQAIDAVQLRRRIGYVFQGVGLFPHMTVAENIAITPKLLGWDAARMSARIDTLLDLVRLDRSKHRGRFPAELSGGEGQRVGVARAIAAEPRIVLMDEPFGALDAMTRERLQDELVDIWSRTGLTVLFVTHSIEEAIFLADRVVVMSPGPGRIDNEYLIDLSRPRDIASPEFNEWRRLLSSQLHSHHGRRAG